MSAITVHYYETCLAGDVGNECPGVGEVKKGEDGGRYIEVCLRHTDDETVMQMMEGERSGEDLVP